MSDRCKKQTLAHVRFFPHLTSQLSLQGRCHTRAETIRRRRLRRCHSRKLLLAGFVFPVDLLVAFGFPVCDCRRVLSQCGANSEWEQWAQRVKWIDCWTNLGKNRAPRVAWTDRETYSELERALHVKRDLGTWSDCRTFPEWDRPPLAM